jgi:hypothetical protein
MHYSSWRTTAASIVLTSSIKTSSCKYSVFQLIFYGALIPTARSTPTPRENEPYIPISANTTLDSDKICALSWLAWASASSKWEAIRYTEPSPDFVFTTRTLGIISTWTECDGIPRARLASTAQNSWLSTITVPAITFTKTQKTGTPEQYPERIPSCSLGSAECTARWHSLADDPEKGPISWYSAVNSFKSIGYPGKDFFGCPMPEQRCRTPKKNPAMSYAPRPGCSLFVGRVALIYWPPDVTSSDLCANDGHGSYGTVIATISTPRVFSTDVVTLHSHNFELPGMDADWMHNGKLFLINFRNWNQSDKHNGSTSCQRHSGLWQIVVDLHIPNCISRYGLQ